MSIIITVYIISKNNFSKREKVWTKVNAGWGQKVGAEALWESQWFQHPLYVDPNTSHTLNITTSDSSNWSQIFPLLELMADII